MNRRRTIERPRGLLNRLRGKRGNRRLKGLRLQASGFGREAPEARSPKPEARRDWGGALRYAGHLALSVVKVAFLIAVLGAVGLGGFYGYRRAMASTAFKVKQVEVVGARRAPRHDLQTLVQGAHGRSIFSVDLGALGRAVEGHPWVKKARASRQLPSRIVVEVDEHRPDALLQLGYLYLVDEDGHVFKRAATDETEGLAVITGVDRADYLGNQEVCRARVRRALAVLARYHDSPRPALSEVNLGARDEVTLYLRQAGIAVRLGTDPSDDRLRRFDAVWAALGPEVRRARAIFLDQEVRTDRVVVRMGSNE
jgi:cell division protein FtsQ